ncbi:hypothetical protein BKA83DRAFT_4126709 [Pisolithus microcarpus]|nr:hypothetical protein BKA83DRAFT_4126709 [Pisolithus microcarpus]
MRWPAAITNITRVWPLGGQFKLEMGCMHFEEIFLFGSDSHHEEGLVDVAKDLKGHDALTGPWTYHVTTPTNTIEHDGVSSCLIEGAGTAQRDFVGFDIALPNPAKVKQDVTVVRDMMQHEDECRGIELPIPEASEAEVMASSNVCLTTRH